MFLNSLRFNPTAALNLRFPVSRTDLPAVKAVLGQQGIVDGINYRGSPVLSALKAIPDSPWFIVANEDKSEVYAPLRERFWLTFLLMCLLELGGGAILLFIWRQQRLVVLQRHYELTQALREKDEQHQHILDKAIDGFLLMDKQMQVLEVNETYCRMSRYTEQELKNMQLPDLQTSETATIIESKLALGIDRFESRHRRKDGRIFDVEISIQYLPFGGGLFAAFIQDITGRKQAEAKLQLAASVFNHAREGIMITADDGTIIQVNNAFCEISGYSREELLGKNPRLLSSGRQEKETYTAMWNDLSTKGHWYGELWNRRKNGEAYAVMENISAVINSQDNSTQYVALMSDITRAKAHEQELEHSAHFDALTNLPNRVLLADRLQQAIAQTRRSGKVIALAFLDLDGFKAINDEHGHLAGDHLLIAVANNMSQILREVDTLARIGGDEFIALLVDVGDAEAREPLFTRILAAAAIPELFGNATLQLSASMGVTFYPQLEEADADILMRQADQAMYQAKSSGKNRYYIFDTALDKVTRSQNESLHRIRLALAANEFELYYQPKVNLRLGGIVGAEALIRWQHPERGLLMPADFLPLIENLPLSIDVGVWVINTAMSQIESWRATGLALPVSVNISALHLQQDNFIASLQLGLKAHPAVQPGDLVMEILETSVMRDLTKVSRLIEECRELGVHFSLDDFGTGYSSLTYLKRLPVSQLKIDQSFVRDMLNDVDDLAIVEGVLALAIAFNLEVVAEGMETIAQGEMLLQIGCDKAQGYAIAKPMPAVEMIDWIANWQPDASWLDRPSFTRDDLPLLFANAEYRVWLNAIDDYLNGKAPKPGSNPSRFGQWLTINSPVKKGAFITILSLHKEFHALAENLIALYGNGQIKEAHAGLAKLHKLKDALLEKLKMLVQENWQ